MQICNLVSRGCTTEHDAPRLRNDVGVMKVSRGCGPQSSTKSRTNSPDDDVSSDNLGDTSAVGAGSEFASLDALALMHPGKAPLSRPPSANRMIRAIGRQAPEDGVAASGSVSTSVGLPQPVPSLQLCPEQSRMPCARQARIFELLRRLEVSSCPLESARVHRRQHHARERHLQQRGLSPAPGFGTARPRRSMSLMDLLGRPADDEVEAAESEASGSARRRVQLTGPVPKPLLDELVSRLPTAPASNTWPAEPCTICLDVPSKDEIITTLTCGHWYHRECIHEWLAHSRLCPLCKASAMPSSLCDSERSVP